MLENLKNILDKDSFAGAMSMDLSPVFNGMNGNLLISKLGAYGFQKDAISFMKSYLTKRQRVGLSETASLARGKE